jgi:hypothetical protein
MLPQIFRRLPAGSGRCFPQAFHEVPFGIGKADVHYNHALAVYNVNILYADMFAFSTHCRAIFDFQ